MSYRPTTTAEALDAYNRSPSLRASGYRPAGHESAELDQRVRAYMRDHDLTPDRYAQALEHVLQMDSLADDTATFGRVEDALDQPTPSEQQPGGDYGDLSPDELDVKVRERMETTGEDYGRALNAVADELDTPAPAGGDPAASSHRGTADGAMIFAIDTTALDAIDPAVISAMRARARPAADVMTFSRPDGVIRGCDCAAA